MRKLYEESSIQNIADSIRRGLRIEDTMNVNEMPNYIDILSKPYINTITNISPSHLDENGNWVRPAEYEDVSQLTWAYNEEVCYLSLYKNNSTPWGLGLYITASKGSQVEYGHVVNGEFVALGEPELIKSNTAYYKLLPEEETTLVAKITSQNYLYPITYFSFYQGTAAQTGAPIAVHYYLQPVVERVGNLPYITSTANSSTTRGFSCASLERDALNFGSFVELTNLSSAWNYSYNLEEIDVNAIDTSHWKVTTMTAMFQQCSKIKKIDLSGWDTSNWAVTNISNMFNACYNLIDLRIGNWNTSNWKITTTSMMFVNCVNLESININRWDTSNWAVTTMANMFQYCLSLKEMNLNNWNTSNWAVTTVAYLFDYCVSLRNVYINDWDVSNWKLTSITYMFDQCRSLVTIDLSKWNTSNWTALNNAAFVFGNCTSLKYPLISNWDTSNWVLTTMASMFTYCLALEELPVENWNTSNWPLTNLGNMTSYCYSLKKIDFSKWDNTKFAITDARTLTSFCRSLSYADFSTIGPAVNATSTYTIATANEINLNLIELYPQQNLQCSFSLASMMNLSKDSLLRVLRALPQATAARTITLGNLRGKLKVKEIAIATEKGWTVA